MKVPARELERGDVLVELAQSGVVTELEEVSGHIRVTFADRQARSYKPDRELALTCARLAACPRGFCDARTCECKPCSCRVCRHRAERVAARTAA
jgi:hypothetical protein